MARREMNAEVYIDIDGESRLWYTVAPGGEVVWHLPKDMSKRIISKIKNNIGARMSEYAATHPDSSLWKVS